MRKKLPPEERRNVPYNVKVTEQASAWMQETRWTARVSVTTLVNLCIEYARANQIDFLNFCVQQQERRTELIHGSK